MPKTTMSKSGYGFIEIVIPKWYDVLTKKNMMYNPAVQDKCTSDQMEIRESTPNLN